MLTTSPPTDMRAAAAQDLIAAVERFDPGAPVESLAGITEKLPVAASVEVATVRLRDRDRDGALHLVAATGLPSFDARRLAAETLPFPRARALLVLRERHTDASAMGLRWFRGLWLRESGRPVGLLAVGSRTERRPDEDADALIEHVALELGARIRGVDLGHEAMTRASRALIRTLAGEPPPLVDSPLRALRPSERAIINLFADGLSTQDVASVLYLSPHTVRTHVKHALRRLGLHSRDEAVALAQEERTTVLI